MLGASREAHHRRREQTCRHRARRRVGLTRRFLAQQSLMRALQVRGRVDAELVGEVYAEGLVPLERLRGTSRGIENVDEACPETLAQRVAFDQLAQPGEAGC